MDSLKSYARKVVNNGLLGAGIIGLYLYHRNNLPDYWRVLSYGVAYLGVQVSASYLLHDDKEKDEMSRAIAERVIKDIKPELLKTLETSAHIKESVEELERRRFIKDWKEMTDQYFYAEKKADAREHPSQLQLALQKSPLLGKQLSPDDIRPADTIVVQKIDGRIEGIEDFDPTALTESSMNAFKKQLLKVGRARFEQLTRESLEGLSTQSGLYSVKQI